MCYPQRGRTQSNDCAAGISVIEPPVTRTGARWSVSPCGGCLCVSGGGLPGLAGAPRQPPRAHAPKGTHPRAGGEAANSDPPRRAVMRIVASTALRWRGNELYFDRRLMLWIEPDGKYSGMWRVRHLDGCLSDMVNLSRARDAARVHALAALKRGEETGYGSPPARLNGSPATPGASDPKNASVGLPRGDAA